MNMNYKDKLFNAVDELRENIDKMNVYEIYSKITKINEMCNDYRAELNGRSRENKISYYAEAAKIMKEDAARYINNFINDHKQELKCTDEYKIRCSKAGKSVMLNCHSDYKSPTVNFKGLKLKLTQFTNNTLFDILGIEEHNILSEDDYMRFLEIRKDPEYIRPSIQYIIDGLYEVDYRNKSTLKTKEVNNGIN